jgi:hypothetical protein
MTYAVERGPAPPRSGARGLFDQAWSVGIYPWRLWRSPRSCRARGATIGSAARGGCWARARAARCYPHLRALSLRADGGLRGGARGGRGRAGSHRSRPRPPHAPRGAAGSTCPAAVVLLAAGFAARRRACSGAHGRAARARAALDHPKMGWRRAVSMLTGQLDRAPDTVVVFTAGAGQAPAATGKGDGAPRGAPYYIRRRARRRDRPAAVRPASTL